MKPKVLFLSTSAQDYPGAGGRTRVISESKFVFGSVYKITLLCLIPLRKFKNPSALLKARRALANDGEFRVIYFPKFSTFKLKSLEGIAATVNASVVALIARLIGVKMIHAHGLTASFLAIKATKNSKVSVLSDMHGVESEEAAHKLGIANTDKQLASLHKMETEVFGGAEQMFVVSNKMKAYLQDHNLRKSNMTLVPCATRAPKTLSFEERNALRNQHGFTGKTVFLYLGSHRPYQLATETVQLFADIKKNVADAHFFILTSHHAEFQNELNALGISKKDYTMFSASQNEIFTYIQLADFGFMLRENSMVNIVASPTKFAEYLLCGLPVITTPWVGDYSSIVEKEHIGFVLKEPKLEPELFGFIEEVMKNRNDVAQKATQYGLNNLTWPAIQDQMLHVYSKLQKAE